MANCTGPDDDINYLKALQRLIGRYNATVCVAFYTDNESREVIGTYLSGTSLVKLYRAEHVVREWNDLHRSLVDFIFCVTGIWSSRTLDPYARERNKVVKDLDHVKTSREALLVSWLVNERVERTQKEEEIGVLKKTLDDTKNIALKLFVIPYFCQKFELYGEHWDTNPKEVVEDFNPDDLSGTSIIKHHLEDEHTRESYTANAKKWNRILSKSVHPLAIKFKKSLQEKYPDVSLSILAKNLGLAIALLNNAKHGVVVANIPEAMELLQTDSAIEALSKWSGLSDPVILDVIYEFEKTTSNRQWKPT